MRVGRKYAARLLHVLLLTAQSLAFGTINEPGLIGQHCEHERITRAAFACAPSTRASDGRCFEPNSLSQLAGTSGPNGYVGQGSNGAVGAPDMLDPVPEGPHAHCDNADFLDSQALGLEEAYPRTRQQATDQLQSCVDHLRRRFAEGVDAADKIVDEHARVLPNEVDISIAYCRFSFPDLQLHLFSRSKCSAIEGFGRSLHGIQDFYAHSNWADDAEPPFSTKNPPGLRRKDLPVFLDLRAENEIDAQVPHNLSTGCFGGIMTDGPFGKPGHPLEPGSLDCTGRVTHHTLNKDNGIIDQITGVTSEPGPNTPRSDYPGNFEVAVTGAIRDSRRQWRHFREEIRRTYGTERGNMIVCSLVRDEPGKDCYGRRVAFVRDTDLHPGRANRIAEIQMPIHRWLLEELEGREHREEAEDGMTSQNATISKGSSDELESVGPERQELKRRGEKKDTDTQSQGLDISSALGQLLNKTSSLASNKSAIIALTRSHRFQLSGQIAHIWRAGDEGIRVHLGVLPSSPTTSITSVLTSHPKREQRDHEDLLTAVLRTGGTYSILQHPSSLPVFLDHAISRGLSAYDNSPDTATLLLPGLHIADLLTPASEPRRYSFDAHTMDNVIVSVAPLSPRLALHATIRHVRRNFVVKEMKIGLGGNATFRAELGVDDIPREDAWFELEVERIGERRGQGELDEERGNPLEEQVSGVFEVGIEMEEVGLSDAHREDERSGRLLHEEEDDDDDGAVRHDEL